MDFSAGLLALKERLEKKEAGFRFEDVSYDLYQEGLLPTKGVITKDVDSYLIVTTNTATDELLLDQTIKVKPRRLIPGLRYLRNIQVGLVISKIKKRIRTYKPRYMTTKTTAKSIWMNSLSRKCKLISIL